jgi:hypothetical protein
LNITLAYWLAGGDFLFEITDRDIEPGTGEQIRGGIMIARLGNLPVRRRASEIRKAQASSKDDKGENNDQRSALSCAVMGTMELFHRVNLSWG